MVANLKATTATQKADLDHHYIRIPAVHAVVTSVKPAKPQLWREFEREPGDGSSVKHDAASNALC